MFLEPVHEGFEVPCPHCGAKFQVPTGAATPGDSAPTGAAPPPGPDAPVPPPRRPTTEGDGSLPLVFGILGLIGVLGSVCTYGCLAPLALLAPVAWVLGHRGRAAARAERREPAGNVTAGWILGILGTGLIVLGLVAIVVVVTFVAVRAS
jgi:hypothetical protein